MDTLSMRLKLQTYMLSLLLGALTCLLSPVTVSAAVSGTAELGYVNYNAEKNGSSELEASSFRHNYSLAYSTGGSFFGGRLGGYRGMLGYEWGSLDTRIVTPDRTFNPSISDGNFLYSGNFVMDPKELPFRLRLYSQDTLRNNFSNDSVFTSTSKPLIEPNVPTEIVNAGTNLETGATLRLGVKNGMTNGYNAIFRHVPLLLLDYVDIVRKDDRSQARTDTHLRRLAFVSLNKKDNWFHYRMTEYNDNISQLQSYTETQVQLGTVDERLTRRWIDFTNWIKLSTDVQFTKRIDNGRLPEESYDANLFLQLTRKKWELRNFNSFMRKMDHNSGQLRFERNVPIYVNGIWGQETDWSARFSYEDDSERQANISTLDSRDLLVTYRINTFSRSRFNLTHSGNVEYFTNLGAKTLVLSGSLSTASTPRFSDSFRIAASYNIMRFDTEKLDDAQTNMTHDLQGKVTYSAPSRRLVLEFTERIGISDGVSSTNNKTTIFASSGFAERPAESSENGSKRVNSTFKVDWTPLERARVGGSIVHEMLAEEGEDATQSWTAQAHATYKQERLSTALSASYTGQSSSTDGQVFRGSADMAYYFNKDMNLNVRGSFTSADTNGSTATNLDFSQGFTYRRFTRVGSPRQLLEATEQLSYTRTAAGSRSPYSSKKLTLGLSYYPWANLFVSNRLSYAWNDPGSQTELIYNGSVGLSYAKLQATLDYSYGTRDAKNDKRKESRLAANVKKFF